MLRTRVPGETSNIAARIIACGRNRDTPVAAIQSATLPDQRSVVATVGTLATAMAAAEIDTPAVLVFGEVAALASDRMSPAIWLLPMPAWNLPHATD